MRSLVIVALVAGTATADPIDVVHAKLAKCPAQNQEPTAAEVIAASLGGVTRVEAVNNRAIAAVAQLFGPKGRAYAFFLADGSCDVIPVAGKATAFAKGNFGGGATVAYIVQPPDCSKFHCPTAVSIKTADDKLVDVVRVEPCSSGADLDKIVLRPGHDSLVLGCWNSGGADRDRTDALLDFDGSLASVIEQTIGIAWVQTDSDPPFCVAKAPGGIAVVSAGAAPIIDITHQLTADEATAANIERRGGGCEQSVKTQRYIYDPRTRRFVPSGAPRYGMATKLCVCPKQH
jgi:hypothetical protein